MDADGPSSNINYTASTGRTAYVDSSHVEADVNNASPAFQTDIFSGDPVPSLASVGIHRPDSLPLASRSADSNVYSTPTPNDPRFANAIGIIPQTAMVTGIVASPLRDESNRNAANVIGLNHLPGNNVYVAAESENALRRAVPSSALPSPPPDDEIVPAPARPVNAVGPFRARGKRSEVDNKKRKAESLNLEKVKKKKERCFSPEDAMKLARAWVSQVSSEEDSSESEMWNAIYDKCGIDHELARTPKSLKRAWDNLRLDIRNFIFARTKINAQRPPRAINDKMERLVKMQSMKLRGRKGIGKSDGAPSYKYEEVADYLSKEPKFMNAEFGDAQNMPNLRDGDGRGKDARRASGHDVQVGGSSKSGNSYREHSGSSSGTNEMKTRDEGKGRKKGRKQASGPVASRIAEKDDTDENILLDQTKMTERESLQEEKRFFQETIERLEEYINRANQIFEESVRRDEDLLLLQVLQKDSSEYKEVLETIMNRRAQEANSNLIQDEGNEAHGDNGLLNSSSGGECNDTDIQVVSAAGPHTELRLGK